MFVAVAAMAAWDLFTDLDEGVGSWHWALESGLLLLGVAGAVMMFRELRRVADQAASLEDTAADLTHELEAKVDQAADLNERLEAKAEEAARFREEVRALLRGLSDAIDKQLVRWELTQAEREVALLLLKGLSHREIAEVRGTTDATARQQSRAIYRKGGLSGRNDLSAFFLEDLLVPQAETETAEATTSVADGAPLM